MIRIWFILKRLSPKLGPSLFKMNQKNLIAARLKWKYCCFCQITYILILTILFPKQERRLSALYKRIVSKNFKKSELTEELTKHATIIERKNGRGKLTLVNEQKNVVSWLAVSKIEWLYWMGGLWSVLFFYVIFNYLSHIRTMDGWLWKPDID